MKKISLKQNIACCSGDLHVLEIIWIDTLYVIVGLNMLPERSNIKNM